MGAVRAYYEKMGDKFVNALSEMLVFDAVDLQCGPAFRKLRRDGR